MWGQTVAVYMVNFLVPLKRKDYKSTMLQKVSKCEVKGRNEVLQVETLVQLEIQEFICHSIMKN